MKTKSRKYKDNKSAFTLVELMMVLMVIMVLMSIVIPVAKYITKRITEERERVFETQIRQGLEQYRLVYGEYPIPGSENHYPTNYDNDPDGLMPKEVMGKQVSPVNLAASPVEELPFTPKYRIDYSLTWPLMLAQEARGEAPYVVFPEETVTRLAYVMTDGVIETKEKKERDGRLTKGEVLVGLPIKRPLAMTRRGVQWYYNSSDGVTYVLDRTNNPRVK